MKIRPDAAGMGPAIAPTFQGPIPLPPLTSIIEGEAAQNISFFFRPDNFLAAVPASRRSSKTAWSPQDLDRWSLSAPAEQRPDPGHVIPDVKPFSRTDALRALRRVVVPGPASLSLT